MRKVFAQVCCHLEAHAGFANATGSSEREQTDLDAPEELADPSTFTLAPNQCGQWHWEIVDTLRGSVC
jgi:hypothetical protein